MNVTNMLGALALAIALPAAAAPPEPKVEYAADTSAETAEGVSKGRVFHASGKERREMNAGGERMATIIRQDKKVIWMLMPEQKAYMEMPLGQSPDQTDVSGWKVEQTVIGPEELDGVKTTKSKVLSKGPRGDKMGGFWWTTADGVVVKMDMLAIEKGSKLRLKMELKNLKVGKQDPALFEIPAGYAPMQMPGMGGLPGMGAMPGASGDEKEGGEKEKTEKKKKTPSMPSLKDLPGLFK
jgi:hypothetical protein